MITATSREANYQVSFSDGVHSALADTTEDKGGGNSGFRPHDLLEAALATCLSMWLKMYAANHGISATKVETKVWIDRSLPDETLFNYAIAISGDVTEDERTKLLQVAKTCAVHQTLSKKISFESA